MWYFVFSKISRHFQQIISINSCYLAFLGDLSCLHRLRDANMPKIEKKTEWRAFMQIRILQTIACTICTPVVKNKLNCKLTYISLIHNHSLLRRRNCVPETALSMRMSVCRCARICPGICIFLSNQSLDILTILLVQKAQPVKYRRKSWRSYLALANILSFPFTKAAARRCSKLGTSFLEPSDERDVMTQNENGNCPVSTTK